jgi:hypothetical protein
MPTIEELVDHFDRPGIDGDPGYDITRIEPGITRERALEVQMAVKRRRAADGDRIIGHQASFTTAGVRKIFPDAPMPMVGTLLASLARNDGDEIVLDSDEAFLECEIALILKRDLEGPDLTDMEVSSAIDCFLPAIEIAPLRPGVREKAYSYEHLIAVQKAPGDMWCLDHVSQRRAGSTLRSKAAWQASMEKRAVPRPGTRRWAVLSALWQRWRAPCTRSGRSCTRDM